MQDDQPNTYTYVERGVVRQRSIESVANSKIDGDLEQIVLKDDEAASNRSMFSLRP